MYEQVLLSSVCCYCINIFSKFAYHFNIRKLHTNHRFSKHTPNSRGGIKTWFLLYFVKVSLQSSDKEQFRYSCISSTIWSNHDVWKCPCIHFYNINLYAEPTFVKYLSWVIVYLTHIGRFLHGNRIVSLGFSFLLDKCLEILLNKSWALCPTYLQTYCP